MRRHSVGPALVLMAATFLLYVATLAPTFSWGDSADLPLRVHGEAHSEAEATARDYVLYRMVGRIYLELPFGDVAYRLNLMSATFATLGVMAVYLMVRRRTRQPAAAAAAALALACSHTWWWMSVVSEIYTFAGSLMLVALWLWLEWTERGGRGRLLTAALVSGLAASAHGAGVLLLLPVTWHLYRCRGRTTRRQLLTAAVGMLAGAGFVVLMVSQALMRGGLAGLREAIDASNPSLSAPLWTQLAKGAVLMLYQYPGVGTVLGAIGVVRMLRSREPWDALVVSSWAVLVVWAALSRIPDVFNAYGLSYALLAPMVGVGSAIVLRQLQVRWPAPRFAPGACIVAAVVVAPMTVYTAVPAAADYLRVDLTGARRCPERNNNWYFLFPPKNGDYGPRRFAEGGLAAAAPDGVIVADYTLWRPLKFLQQVEGIRPDVHLQIVDPLLGGDALPDFISKTLRSRSVYLAAIEPPSYYDLPRLQKAFLISQAGPIFELRARP